MMRVSALVLFLSALIGCGTAPAAERNSGVEAEARRFMAGYAADMQRQNRDGLAARYQREGAYWVLHGRKRFLVHDSIVAYFREQWLPPDEFRWEDMSYEVLGDDAVVVIGLMRFNDPDGRSAIGSYTAVLVREDGELRIRVEDEAFDNFPAGACAPTVADCGVAFEPATAARYLGEYDQGAFRWRILEADGQYLAELPWAPATRLLYYGDHEFRLADDPSIRILFDGSGERATSYTVFRGQLFGSGRRVP
jgi:hypothetical protein